MNSTPHVSREDREGNKAAKCVYKTLNMVRRRKSQAPHQVRGDEEGTEAVRDKFADISKFCQCLKMSRLVYYLKSLWPMASVILWGVWLPLLAIGSVRWLNGSFVAFSSLDNFLYRFSFVIYGIPLIAFLGSALCDLIERIKDYVRGG